MRKSHLTVAVALAATVLVVVGCVPPPTPHPPNAAPVAAATGTPTSATTPLQVQFSSAGSTDSDGTIVEYLWDFGDGGTSTEANPIHTYAAPGSFNITLTVTDNRHASGTATTTVTVSNDATGRYVSTSGSDTPNCSASQNPCLTINYAIGQAQANDTVYVAAGQYPEIVNPTKALTFKGANYGVAAGTSAAPRGPESVVQGFRGGGTSAAEQSFVLDGFRIDPTTDPALVSQSAVGLINVFGGSTVSIVNNVFSGANTFVPDCGYQCTNMADYAIYVRSGNIDISENSFVNWRRPINVAQSEAAHPITAANIENNVFNGITSRAMSIGYNTGQGPMPGVTVTGNSVDAGPITSASTPAGITVSNGSNQISGNTFRGFSSAIYMQLCKKFDTNNNLISSNSFEGNGAGVNIVTTGDTSQCMSGVAEGSGGWVVGGGQASGLKVNGNSFTGQASYALKFNPNYGAYTPAITTGDLDATCNWFGNAAGPGDPLLPGDRIVQGPLTNAQFVSTPWLTSQGGTCDGGI
ncbi:MAG TPA: PKD domain-containing protein [Microthrixaceae bacterium]|nr:PKD domain-containing protein [Microthrixaceae bacterium]